MCPHSPTCPPATASDRDAAHVVADHGEQGWSLLCNGVVCFDDGLDLLPDGHVAGCVAGQVAGQVAGWASAPGPVSRAA